MSHWAEKNPYVLEGSRSLLFVSLDKVVNHKVFYGPFALTNMTVKAIALYACIRISNIMPGIHSAYHQLIAL